MIAMMMTAARAISHQFCDDWVFSTVAAGAGPAGSSCVGAGAGAGSTGEPWPLASAGRASAAAKTDAVTNEVKRFTRSLHNNLVLVKMPSRSIVKAQIPGKGYGADGKSHT